MVSKLFIVSESRPSIRLCLFPESLNLSHNTLHFICGLYRIVLGNMSGQMLYKT